MSARSRLEEATDPPLTDARVNCSLFKKPPSTAKQTDGGPAASEDLSFVAHNMAAVLVGVVVNMTYCVAVEARGSSRERQG